MSAQVSIASSIPSVRPKRKCVTRLDWQDRYTALHKTVGALENEYLKAQGQILCGPSKARLLVLCRRLRWLDARKLKEQRKLSEAFQMVRQFAHERSKDAGPK